MRVETLIRAYQDNKTVKIPYRPGPLDALHPCDYPLMYPCGLHGAWTFELFVNTVFPQAAHVS